MKRKIIAILFGLFALTLGISCPTNWGTLDASTITAVDPLCFQNISASDVFIFQSSACSALSISQFSAIPETAFNGFQANCLAVVNGTVFANISSLQVSMIPAEAFALLNSNQIQQIPAGSCAGFTSNQVFGLGTACSGVTPSCFSNFGNSAMAAISTTCVQNFSPLCFAVIQPSSFGAISAEAAAFLSASQIQSLVPMACEYMTASQLASLGTCGLTVCSNACTGFTPNCTRLIGLTNMEIGNVLRSSCLLQIPPTAVGTLSAATFGNIFPAPNPLVPFLTPAQAAALPVQSCSLMTAEQVRFLGSSCSGLSPACINVIGLHNPWVGQGFTQDCLSALSPAQVGAIAAATFYHIVPTTQPFTPFLTPAQVGALGTDTCGLLQDYHLRHLSQSCSGLTTQCLGIIGISNPYVGAAFTQDCISSLSPAQIGAIAAATFFYIQPQLFQYITATQAANFSTDECELLQTDQLRSLSGQFGCSGLSFECLNWIGLHNPYVGEGITQGCLSQIAPAGFGQLPGYVFYHIPAEATKWMTSQQISFLRGDNCFIIHPDQALLFEENCAGFQPDCVGNFSINVVNNMKWTCWISMPSNSIAALTPNNMRWLSADATPGLDARVLSSFNGSSCSGLKTQQISGFGTLLWNHDACSGLAGSCVSNIVPEAIAGLLPPCASKMNVDAISGISAPQLQVIPVRSVLSWNSTQFAALQPTACAGLTNDQVDSFTATCSFLSVPCFSNINSTAIPSFGAACASQFSSAVITSLVQNQQLNLLSVSALQSFTANQLQTIAAAVTTPLPCGVVNSFTPPQSNVLVANLAGSFATSFNACLPLSNSDPKIWLLCLVGFGGMICGASLTTVFMCIWKKKKNERQYVPLLTTDQ